MSELRGSFALTINRHVHDYQKDLDEHMKGFHKETLNIKWYFSNLLNYEFQRYTCYDKPVREHQ